MSTPEQDRAVRQFLPSLYRSQRFERLKPYFFQGIILAQATVAAALALLIAPILQVMFDEWGPAAMHGGVASAVWLLIGVASKTVIPFCICSATIWWLGQQKKLLKP